MADGLFLASVSLKNGQTMRLAFKHKERAVSVRRVLSETGYVGDDYGAILHVSDYDIAAVYVQDCALASEVEVEMMLRQARDQAKARRRAGADPAISASGGLGFRQ